MLVGRHMIIKQQYDVSFILRCGQISVLIFQLFTYEMAL